MPFPLGNRAVSASTGTPGERRDPYLGCNFLVEAGSLIAGGFREVRGLESSMDVREYAEGGLNEYLHKLPGPVRYPNLVFSRGLIGLDTLWTWYDEASRGIIRRHNLSVMLLDGLRRPVLWWDIRAALPVKWTGPAFNATSDADVATESIELVHRGIVRSNKAPESR